MKILLATDGSVVAQLAEAVISKVRPYREAEIIVASVAAPVSFLGPMMMPGADLAFAAMGADLAGIALKHAEQRATQAVERLRALGMNAAPVFAEGPVEGTLVQLAQEHGCTLIVAGSHGENAVAGFLLGSVARGLVNSSPISVLLVRTKRDEAPETALARVQSAGSLNALVAIDGTEGAKKVLETIAGYGPGTFASVSTLCATPLSALPPGLEPELIAELVHQDVDAAKHFANEAAAALQATGGEVKSHVVAGRPGAVVVEVAESEGSDLIAIGASRHGTLERLLLGSVAYEVATTAPCSTLIIRPT